MPNNKNQHFVPRCHLRPFSADGEGRAINLFNLKSDRAIRDAPTKGQCARDYFYGKDLEVEGALRRLEGHYATIIRRLEAGTLLTDVEMNYLRDFAFLQVTRTEAAIERFQELDEGMRGAVFKDWHRAQPMPDRDWFMRATLRSFKEGRPYILDLKPCVLSMQGRGRFVTSDDPAVTTNRLHIQRWNDANFGWMSSGALLFMPLTPQHCLMCYDGLTYTVPGKSGGAVELPRDNDVDAINELQFIHCNSNVYFRDWSTRDVLAVAVRSVAGARPVERAIVETLILDRVINGVERYRSATLEEKEGDGPFLLKSVPQHPRPTHWPSVLRYRDPIRTFSNGSAAGHVRKPEWLRSRP